jgi:hypothetical protein
MARRTVNVEPRFSAIQNLPGDGKGKPVDELIPVLAREEGLVGA